MNPSYDPHDFQAIAPLLKKQYSYKFKLNLPFYLEIYVLLVNISIINLRYSDLVACSSIELKNPYIKLIRVYLLKIFLLLFHLKLRLLVHYQNFRIKL